METIDKVKELISSPKKEIEWVGVFGEITYKEGKGRARISLECSCGTIAEVLVNRVLTYNTRSCGCLRHKTQIKKSHGGKPRSGATRLYRIWSAMRERCRRHDNVSYPNYGGRGIDVCPEWKESFTAFRDWAMSNGYSSELSLDRIENDLDYSPSNCKWSTKSEQARNTRSNRFVTIGCVTLCVVDWCKELSISPSTVYRRVKKGWSWEDAILKPSQRAKIKQSN